MRLWVIGLLALLLIGVLLAIGQTGLFDEASAKRGEAHAFFPDFEARSISYYSDGGRTVFVAMALPDAPLILSGLPSYMGSTFRLPIDARPDAGSYNVYFHTDTAPGTEAVLRVTINGRKRADVLLEQGRRDQQAEIKLTPSELSARELDVKIALIGRGPLAECTPSEALAAVVTILPRSGLTLQLDKPPTSWRDALALWGDLIPVEWPGIAAPADTEVMITAARLLEHGDSGFYGDKGIARDKLKEVLAAVRAYDASSPQGRRRSSALAYPVALLTDPANAGARSFDRETSWRFSYDFADMPGGQMPGSLDLRMVLGPVSGTRTAMLVTLNDHLVYTRTFAGKSEREANGALHVNQSIQLDPAFQMARNELVVTLSSYSAEDIRCGPQRMLAAEMLPSTVLQPGNPIVLPITQVREALRANLPVRFTSPSLNAPDARAATILLAELQPERLRFDPKAARSSIEVVDGDAAARVEKLKPGGTRWILSAPFERRDLILAEPLTPQAKGLRDNVALIVTVNRPAATPPPPSSPPPSSPPAPAAAKARP